jgi:hypothetical protein
MALVKATAARQRRSRWTLLVCAGIGICICGAALLQRATTIALWLFLSGAIVAHWAARRASDCTVLMALAGVPLHRIATAVAMMPPQSSTPLSDLARMRAAGGGAVKADGAMHLLSLRRIERGDTDLLLSGRWCDLAVPAVTIDGTVPADRLARLPDEDEVWLVRTPSAARMLSGDLLRVAAAAARADGSGRRTDRGRPAAAPAAADERPSELAGTEARR